MAQIYKAQMTKTYTFFVEASDEESLMDWMQTHGLEEVADRTDDYEVEYDDQIICPVDGYADFSIVDEED